MRRFSYYPDWRIRRRSRRYSPPDHNELGSVVGFGETIKLTFPTKKEYLSLEKTLDRAEVFPWMNLEDPFLPGAPKALDALPIRFRHLKMRIRVMCDFLSGRDKGESYSLALARSQKVAPLLFAIKSIVDDSLLGMIALQVSILQQTGIVRTMVLPEYSGQGYGRKAKCLVLQLAFEHLDLECVSSSSLVDNHATTAINGRLGFVTEGILRSRAQVGEERKNLCVMALLREEYQAHMESRYHAENCENLTLTFLPDV